MTCLGVCHFIGLCQPPMLLCDHERRDKDRIYKCCMVHDAHAHTFTQSIHSLRFGCVQFRISDVRNLEIGSWKWTRPQRVSAIYGLPRKHSGKQNGFRGDNKDCCASATLAIALLRQPEGPT